MRYFVRCRYKGTQYHGWQRQPHTPKTIQQELEDALSLVTREQITIVGCGRTDAGVHAADYYFHFDTAYQDVKLLLYKANQIVSNDINCRAIMPVHSEAHARYDATERGYTYYMSKEKDAFRQQTAYTHLQKTDINIEKMQAAASVLLGTHSFEAFCKSNTDVTNKRCTVVRSQWTETETDYQYEVRANRFLRGMIRLVVGMCINVSRDKISLHDVETALAKQHRLPHDWSVPAQGLFLDRVEYDWPQILVPAED